MSEPERLEGADSFYLDEIAPFLPEKVLDFHTHIWTPDQYVYTPDKAEPDAQKYMMTERDYPAAALLADGKRAFPDREYAAVCFGHPAPAVDIAATNDCVASAAAQDALFPLVVAGGGCVPIERLRALLDEGPFLGYKVYLPWIGNDYGDITVEDMLTDEEMRIANERRLVVLLHVPSGRRLADPRVQESVRRLAGEYGNAQIVLAHCGRCYLYGEMKRAIGAVRDLQNVCLDTSMVMDPIVLEMVFDNIDSTRVLYATDFPVAAMKGRRIRIRQHWVDVVGVGYPESAYRVGSDTFPAAMMAREIALAVRQAGEMAGLSHEDIRAVYHDNGMALLRRVEGGRGLERLQTHRNAQP